SEIGPIFSYISTTRGAIAIGIAPLDSGRRIGRSTLLQEVITVDRGPASQHPKKAKIGKIGPDLRYICTTRYGETDGTIRLSASNRSNYPLPRRSDSR